MLQFEKCESNVRKSWHGWIRGWMGRSQECRWPPEDRQDKQGGSVLQPPKRSAALLTLDVSSLRPISDFWPLDCKIINCDVLTTKFVVIYYSSNKKRTYHPSSFLWTHKPACDSKNQNMIHFLKCSLNLWHFVQILPFGVTKILVSSFINIFHDWKGW